jgi:hypothetical protein
MRTTNTKKEDIPMGFLSASNHSFMLNNSLGAMNAQGNAFALNDAKFANLNSAYNAAVTGQADDPQWQFNMMQSEKSLMLQTSNNDLMYKIHKQLEENAKKRQNENVGNSFSYLA